MSGGFKKCQWCGSIFSYVGHAFCPKCLTELDEKFVKIRKYLYENPNANVEMVAEATEVEAKVIKHFLREGRLQLKTSGGSTLTCEKCGAPVTSGRLCENCMKNLSSQMESVLPQSKALEQGKSASAKSEVKESYVRKHI